MRIGAMKKQSQNKPNQTQFLTQKTRIFSQFWIISVLITGEKCGTKSQELDVFAFLINGRSMAFSKWPGWVFQLLEQGS